MPGRRPNPRLAKLHRSYTVQEAAAALGKHKSSVRRWIAEGLPTIDGARPTLISGRALREFLLQRHRALKQPCADDDIFCVKCRAPKKPLGGMVDFVPTSETTGNLQGLCPDCGRLINRRTSLNRLKSISPNWDVASPKGQ